MKTAGRAGAGGRLGLLKCLGRLPLWEMARYGLVGFVNTAVGLSAILVGMHVIGMHYALANALGYGLGLIVSYLLNRRFTFRSSSRILSREPLLFLLVFAVSYAIQMGMLILCAEKLGIDRSLAQILAMGVYVVSGYAGNRLITFRRRTSSSALDRRTGSGASC